eukprot:1547186-Amphidinium_carterae.1
MECNQGFQIVHEEYCRYLRLAAAEVRLGKPSDRCHCCEIGGAFLRVCVCVPELLRIRGYLAGDT